MNIDEFAEGFIKIYEASCVGANCHIVLDDLNIDNEHIEFCMSAVDKNYHDMKSEIQDIEREILKTLLFTPKKRREELIEYARNKYYIKIGSPNAVYQ